MAVNALGRRIPAENHAVKGGADDRVVGEFDNGCILKMGLLRALPFRDVFNHRQRNCGMPAASETIETVKRPQIIRPSLRTNRFSTW